MVETGYRELIVLRHAKTEQVAGTDRDRKLTSRGRSDSRAAGQWLRDNDLEPDVVLTSPAARARATAELVTAEFSTSPGVRIVEDLYGAAVDEAIEAIAAVEDAAQRVLIVGHNPTMEELAYALQGEPADAGEVHLPTAGIAVLRVTGEWAELGRGDAELTHWQVPRG